MREPSSAIRIPPTPGMEMKEMDSSPIPTETPQIKSSARSSVSADRTLASAANLVKLLPSGTVFAFQALSPSFSNHGSCSYTSNKYLTSFLIGACAISCCFFSFTDSFMGRDGKIYYGVATFKGLYVFNQMDGEEGGGGGGGEEEHIPLKDLKRFRILWIDYVHAVFSVVVFMTIAFSDSDVQMCFFRGAGPNKKAFLGNLSLGAAFLSSLVFLIFPTSRKGIGYSDMAPQTK